MLVPPTTKQISASVSVTPIVASGAHPKNTILDMAGAENFSDEIVEDMRRFRTRGGSVKINMILKEPPRYIGVDDEMQETLRHTGVNLCPSIDYLERAFDESKYGNFSRQPYLEATIPSLTDPTLAPDGKHVMSIYMQYAPYKLKGGWDQNGEAQRKALGQTVVQTLAQYAPNLPEMILTHQIITPQDLEDIYGLTGGQIFHGDLALDQFFTMRPLLDWARYKTPITNLYLCGSGTHPGAGLTGGSGANAAREILRNLKK